MTSSHWPSRMSCLIKTEQKDLTDNTSVPLQQETEMLQDFFPLMPLKNVKTEPVIP